MRINSLEPISKLPSELLCEIFLYVAGIRCAGRYRPANWRSYKP